MSTLPSGIRETEIMDTTALQGQSRDLGLELSRTALYPPLSHDGVELVQFSTTVAQAVAFEYTLNGVPGEVAGFSLYQGHNNGNLRIDRAFIAQYQGGWPARLEIQAYQDEVLMDSATVLLHDTRNMVVHRCEITVSPNPLNIVAEVENQASVSAAFFDENGLGLPDQEMSWEVDLPQAPPGVVLEGRQIKVSPEAQPGEVVVRVRQGAVFEDSTTLLMQPAEDIGLELNQYHLYPPLLNPGPLVLWIKTSLADESGLGYRFTINDAPFATGVGILRMEDTGAFGIVFENHFVTSFPGAWPARLRLLAYIDKSLVASTTLWLYDTKVMECHSIDLEFRPSDTVAIPDTATVGVVAMARLHDANGILLPHDEVNWSASLIEPVEGVEMLGHVVLVSPQARPGTFRVGVRGPGGLNRARVLTLT
ncbi:hypothetical protein V0R50_27375 [Pseudomonas sp. 148P]|uniref:Ig-like domain-containing protein n=1 Tax=Pseudomonas ulcerans TaxID=3115852 RepID=A0ABU7HZF2_9PSED|nr:MULTISPECIES: hypothetical protein [unclassified Pseudomonas]MEE1925011.1 hypothetical protein [Pseudomonas sp. 147P]MEE1936960.1 hypothetical protein [Pseudomonas sp. 148P]